MKKHQGMTLKTAPDKSAIIRLYEAVVGCLESAQQAHINGNEDQAKQQTDQAMSAILALDSMLDTKHGGVVAKKIKQLYSDAQKELTCFKVDFEPDHLEPVLRRFRQLSNSWKAVAWE